MNKKLVARILRAKKRANLPGIGAIEELNIVIKKEKPSKKKERTDKR